MQKISILCFILLLCKAFGAAVPRDVNSIVEESEIPGEIKVDQISIEANDEHQANVEEIVPTISLKKIDQENEESGGIPVWFTNIVDNDTKAKAEVKKRSEEIAEIVPTISLKEIDAENADSGGISVWLTNAVNTEVRIIEKIVEENSEDDPEDLSDDIEPNEISPTTENPESLNDEISHEINYGDDDEETGLVHNDDDDVSEKIKTLQLNIFQDTIQDDRLPLNNDDDESFVLDDELAKAQNELNQLNALKNSTNGAAVMKVSLTLLTLAIAMFLM